MIKDFIQPLLADPVDGGRLNYDPGVHELVNTASGTRYSIKNDVPVLLPPNEHLETTDSPLHHDLHTNFKYADHYEKDTISFDYFEEDESAATRNERRRSREAMIGRVLPSHTTILDVGCGSGWVARYFLPKNRQVISMDISTSNPERVLREQPSALHAALTADVYHLPLQPASVDCIIASEIMEHVYDPALFVSKLLSVLKPGGRLLILTPYNQKIKYQLCVHCNQPTPESAHLHSFNEQNISRVLPAEGVDWNTTAFCNKYAVKLRLYNLLSVLPYNLWRLADKLVNAVKRKPSIFLLEINKT